MNITRLGLLALGAALMATSVQAETLDDRWYISPGVSYIIADDDRLVDDDVGFQLGIGKTVSEHWNIELNAVYDELDLESGIIDEFRQAGASLDGLFFLHRQRHFAPYLGIGAGALRTTYFKRSNTNAMANVGVGFMSQLNDHGLALRADARYRMDYDNDNVALESRFGDWLITLGLALPFGDKPKAAPSDADNDGVADSMDRCPGTPARLKVDARGCEIDSDGDGVGDSLDRCPTTPTGAKVNAQGCELDSDFDGVVDSKDRCPTSPVGAKVNAQGCELDSDGDRVVDSKDRCPNTPAGTKVDAQGCELDGDGDRDGIVDSKDRCPNTAAGAKVDSKGCELKAVISLQGVKFANNSAELTVTSQSVLNEAAATLRLNPELKVEVAGHTDNRGARAYNVSLSQRRAESVMNYLISKGASATKLSARGYGPDQPQADNATAQGRAANRRVELRILAGR